MTVAQSAPFLDFQSFTAESPADPPPQTQSLPPTRSPFLSVYELEGQDAELAYDTPVREAYAAFVGQLHDEEFDEALYELQSHARTLHDEQLAMGSSRAEADRQLGQQFSRLIQESEAAVDAMARQFGSRDEASLAEHEFDSFLDTYAPAAPQEPEFENFFGKLVKKIGKVAKAAASTAWKGIKTVALGPILNSLKSLLKPLLNSVLQRAIGALPALVQPAARKLAEKLGFAAPAPAPSAEPAPAESAGSPVQATSAGNVEDVQEEFNAQLASAFLAQDEVELNMEVAQVRSRAASGASPVFAQLDDAREQFIRELNELEAGESAEPYIQNFVPALLPALRMGLRLVGRQRVVDFLAKLLAKLVAKLTGPEQAPALSKAIVNAGLKLLNLEMSEAEQAGLGAAAVAATVEETLTRVASLPDYVLDNQELLQGFALEAFEQAAAANLPALFSESTYRQRPELLEAGVNAGWVSMPLRGRKRYKRCTRVFKARVSPHLAEEVDSFDGAPLAEYFQDLLGLPEGAEVEAEVHLYEALPGTSLADIAHGERETLGPGLSDTANAAQLHPLTPQAAAVLLGKPGLGRGSASALDGRNLAAGQRLYHLAIPGRRPLSAAGRSHRPRLRRRLHLKLRLDSIQDQVQVCLFLSEVKAQKLALRLQQQANAGAAAVGLRRWVAPRLARIFSGAAPRHLQVVHAGLRPGQPAGAALRNLPRSMAEAFAARMQEWLVQGFAQFIQTQSPRLLAAAQDPADGLSLRFTIEHPPGLKAFCQALAGQGPAGGAADAGAQDTPPSVRVDVFTGHHCA